MPFGLENYMLQSLPQINDQHPSSSVFYVHQDNLIECAEKFHPDGIWQSSENFITFKQKDDTHQLITSENTGEVIMLIPARNHQLTTMPPDLEERVKKTLRKSLQKNVSPQKVTKNARVNSEVND